MGRTRWTYIIAAIFFFTACKESKYLAQNQYLYSGNKIKIQSSVPITSHQSKELKSDLKALLRPRLNSSILGIRFKLWVYNISGNPKNKKGLRYWLKYKVGEAPVLASGTTLEKNRDVLQNHLENKGYFHDSVTVDRSVKRRELTAVYTAQIGFHYAIRNVTYPSGPDTLSREILTLQKHSLLVKGNGYDLDMIKDERTRIDSRLKQKGFYYFNPDYLLVDVDSTVGDHKVDMKLQIKQQTPPKAKEIYTLNDIIVFADYDIHSDTSLTRGVTDFMGYKIVDSAKLFRPVIFSRSLIFKPGDTYKRDDHNLSLNRLVTLGVFKFVKARFQETDTANGNKLNAFYYLTPAEKKSLRFEVSALTRSDNSTGGELAINWRNRNLFKGAELFTVNVFGGLDEQFVSMTQSIATRRYGADVNLYIPRIISPFHINTNGAFVPKTRLNVGYELFDRSSQYSLSSIKTSYGYIFKENIQKEHQLSVLSINYVNPSNINPAYQLVLDTNITLRRSIERQFIIGSIYNFNYNSQAKQNHRPNNFYFNANLDLSGNLLGLITGANVNKGKEIDIFNTPFSQYVRVELDFRHYLTLGKYSSFDSRITGGVGYAYGNSVTMPFIKEFFAGGTNDIRAFRSRGLGPGSYYANPNQISFLPDQPGDIKMEANFEYRAKLFSIVRWAMFVDAGNVWTFKEDTSRPGSGFTPSFLKDVAVGIGTGLRFDISILVLRVDFAVPVREPWLPDGSKWIFRNVTDISKYALNLAIGYPF